MNFVFDDGEYSVLETALFDPDLPAGMYLVAVGQCKCCFFTLMSAQGLESTI